MKRSSSPVFWVVVLLLGASLLFALSRAIQSGRGPRRGGLGSPDTRDFVVRAWRKEGRAQVVYADGTSVEFDGEPRRIASTLPGITEMIAALGALDRLVAVSPYCDYPPEVRALPRIDVHPFDAEAVLDVRPDLVVVDRRLHRRDIAVIQRRVPKVLMLDTSRSLGHLAASMDVLAAVLGGPARERVLAWRKRMTAVEARAWKDAPDPPLKVLVVGQWDPLYVMGSGSLLDDLVRLCGCLNVAQDLEGDASGTFSEELVLARRPDWILWTAKQPMPDGLRERWRNVPAVKAGRLRDVSADDIVRAGPRIVEGFERLAQILQGREGK